MTISLGNALLALKEDEKWVKKILIGGVIIIALIIATIMMEKGDFSILTRFVGSSLYLILGSFFMGFILSSGNKMINSSSNAMAEWSEKNLLLHGLKFLLCFIVYAVAFVFLFTLISIVLFLAIGLVLGLIYFVIGLLFHIDCQTASPIFTLVTTVLSIIFTLYFLQFYNAANASYLKNLSFKDLMAFKKQFKMIKENPHASWTLVGKEILYGLLFLFVCFVAAITIIGVILLPFIYFAAYIVITNLYAQYGRQIDIGRYLEN